jgi:hypothetical protein
MAKYILFVGPVSLLFVLNFAGLYLDREYTAEIVRSYAGKDTASLDPVCLQALQIAVRAAALRGAASSFLSIYLFRVMVVAERERVTAFLGIMLGGGLALGTTIAALALLKITWLSVVQGLLFIPITIGLFMGLFADARPATPPS